VAISDTRHDTRQAPPAPGDLELLQRFMNLHVHDDQDRSVDPPLEMVRGFLVDRRLLREGERFTEADRETYLQLRRAIRNLISAGTAQPITKADAETLDRIAASSRLHPRFHTEQAPTLEPQSGGAAAAFGRMVAIAFVGAFDGSLEHLKLCADETCRSVFYDRSKNRSGRWCSMSSCGNRAKVRAWRERQRIGT
jgi:predicted RNA-binding Zn ribbon-like protein